MFNRKHVLTIYTVSFLACHVAIFSMPAHADEAAAFIGGMLTTKVLSNMQRRTEAEEAQAKNSAGAVQPVQQVAPASPASQTVEQKLEQLDKLAAGGYITPEEYKAKRKAILDSL